jgi:hypothetical protein
MTAVPHDPTEISDEPTVLASWTNPTSIELDRRKAELEAMPGYQLKLDLEALGRAGHVMHRNAQELSRHATEYLTGRRGFSRDVGDEFENELVRYLHNYLTSVFSLIEAQRVVMRHCFGDKSEFELGEYTEHRKSSFETGEAEFMTELRHYCTHRSIPLPGISTTFSGGGDRPSLLINRLTLDRAKLLESKGWSGSAKAYLNARNEHFDLWPVIESYVNTASSFFNWFVQRINELKSDEMSDYLKAANDLRDWYVSETGLTEEFINGPGPLAVSPGGRVQRRRAERQLRKDKGRRKHP